MREAFPLFFYALRNDSADISGSLQARHVGRTEWSARIIARARHRRHGRTDHTAESRARPKSCERETRERSERRRARTVRGQCSGTSERCYAGFVDFADFCSAVKRPERPTLAARESGASWVTPLARSRLARISLFTALLYLFLSLSKTRASLSLFLYLARSLRFVILSFSLSLYLSSCCALRGPRVRLFRVTVRSIIIHSQPTTAITTRRWRPSRHWRFCLRSGAASRVHHQLRVA